MAAKNSYADMAELIADYIAQDVDDYLGQSISVNSVTLSCDVYRVEDGTSLTNAIFTGCTENDDHTQIVVGRNLSVASGVTLTPPYRCKGLFIGSPGQFNNNGTISMTSRGASAAGQNIKLVNSYSISATGGSGGSTASNWNANVGSTASGLSCAGGGSGADGYKGGSGYGGAGGSGTSYSGGAGGAGNGSGHAQAAGSSSGGAGGSGASISASYGYANCGGAGNPGGSSPGGGASGSSGTGGLLVIFADILNQNGILTSQGSAGAGSLMEGNVGGGGGSGGGCIVLFSKIPNITGTYNVNGGAGGTTTNKNYSYSITRNGGAGGTGKYASYTVTDMIIAAPTDLSLALTMEEYMDELDPVDGRLLGLMDNDELVYEFSGKRHRAMRTDADFTEFPVPPTSQFEDAVITNPQDGDVLVYDGIAGKWKNGSIQKFSAKNANGFTSVPIGTTEISFTVDVSNMEYEGNKISVTADTTYFIIFEYRLFSSSATKPYGNLDLYFNDVNTLNLSSYSIVNNDWRNYEGSTMFRPNQDGYITFKITNNAAVLSYFTNILITIFEIK